MTIPWALNGSGYLMGLGFVLSFGYWCTNFLVVQRAMAADSMAGARKTPLDRCLSQDVPAGPGDHPGHDSHRPDKPYLNPVLNCP